MLICFKNRPVCGPSSVSGSEWIPSSLRWHPVDPSGDDDDDDGDDDGDGVRKGHHTV